MATKEKNTKNKDVNKKMDKKEVKNTENIKESTEKMITEQPEAQEKSQPKKREKLDEHMLVNIASGVQGGLTYISQDGNTYLRFEQYDDRDVIELKDLRRMMSSARSFLQRGWIRVLDPEVVEYLNIQRFQELTVEPEDLEDLISSTPEHVSSTINSASSNAKSLIYNYAKEKYLSGELKDIHIIKAIEEGLGESLDPNS